MITPIESLSTKKKVAIAATVAAVTALNVAAAVRGKKILTDSYQYAARSAEEIEKGMKFNVLQKLGTGYTDIFQKVSEKAVTLFASLKEKAQTLSATLKEKLPQKVQKAEEAFEEGTGI